MAKGIVLEKNGVLTEAGKAQQVSNTRRTDGKKGLNDEAYNSADFSSAGAPIDPNLQKMGQPQAGVSQPTPAGMTPPAPIAPKGNIPLTPQQQQTYDTAMTKYQKALPQMQGQAPQDAGVGKMQAQEMLNQVAPLQPDMSATDALLMEDKGWQSLMQAKEEYFNPETQKASLMDTYNKLYKKSGLDQLDEEIIDAKTVIEGTEDDIRNEVEQAGGFGTDSQVQALALSRNKVLLKNYNNLVAMRESKAEHLGTMMNLAEKDRAYADQQFDRMLNYDMQMLNYRDKFVQNARDQYNKYTPQQLQAMLAGNPRQLAFAEQIMGVGQGGIARLASAPLSESDQLDLDIKRSQLDTDKLQRDNLRSQINERDTLASQDEELGSYVTAYQSGQIPLTQVPQKIRGQVLAQVQSSGYNKMLDLLGQYKGELTGTGFFGALNPEKRAMLQGLQGQITAEYKQQKQLGTLDAGVQTLIDKIIPDPTKFSITALNNKAQLGALDNFIQNQGGGAIPAPDGSGDTIIITD